MWPLEENSISELTLRPINPDGTYGEEIKLEDFGDITVYPAENSKDADIAYLKTVKIFSEPITISGTIKMPHKNISRKKFKKWLMHFPWINRNEAEAYCQLIGIAKGRISYGATYQDTAFIMSFERPGIALFNSFTRQLKETEK